MSSIIQFRGQWSMENHAPLRCDDPEKLQSLIQMPLHAIDKGIITFKECKVLEYLSRFDKKIDEALDTLIGGSRKWRTQWENLVVNEGLDHALDVVLSGGTQDTSWFVGLLAASPTPLATWGATEIGSNDFVNYDEPALQAFVDGGVISQSLNNSASTADFTIDTNSSTIGGAFLIGTNAKATPAGTVYAAGAFTGGNKSADDNDTLSVTSTFSSAAA